MKKGIIRKIIYLFLFALIIGAFVYLGNKYENKRDNHILVISDYYKDVEKDKFEVIRGARLINLLKSGNNLIFIGSSQYEYSIKYMELINEVVKEINVDKVYYYDIVNDKSQLNSNYYEIVEALSGSLTTSDSTKNNLVAPSFYILNDGEVKYYNTQTAVMKNTDNVDKYWTEEKELLFRSEIITAINDYYLNK
jgi:hypothetical protein